MKTIVKNIVFIAIVITGTWLVPQKTWAQNEDTTHYKPSVPTQIPTQNQIPVQTQVPVQQQVAPQNQMPVQQQVLPQQQVMPQQQYPNQLQVATQNQFAPQQNQYPQQNQFGQQNQFAPQQNQIPQQYQNVPQNAGVDPNQYAPQNGATDQNSPVTLQVFYDELTPYGTWIDDPTLGYVWAPNVDQNFKPYVTNGHWAYTDYGWTWVSDFSWGWAPFHYGRWTVDARYGNIWIPDTVWGPAWVSWRQSDGYVGWTPMGPGVDINYAMGNSYNVPFDNWYFVRDYDFLQYDLFRFRLGRDLCFNIFNSSLFCRNYGYDSYRHNNYFFGPRRDVIQRYTGYAINQMHIRDYNRPGQSYDRSYLNIYRPQMQRNNAYGMKAAPRSMNGGIAGRNVQNNYRGNSSPVRGSYTNQGRPSQSIQQQNVGGSRSQSMPQSFRNTNAYSQGRTMQPGSQQMNQRQMSSYQGGGSAMNSRQQPTRSYSSQPMQRSQSYSSPSQGSSRMASYSGGNSRMSSNSGGSSRMSSYSGGSSRMSSNSGGGSRMASNSGGGGRSSSNSGGGGSSSGHSRR